jgi:predicted nucleotidyltransferase component of viral defense system
MNTDKQNFLQLVERAMANQQVGHMRAVIEKELLHYDILFALEQAGLLNDLVFQGGTSLRLCYRGNRFSEDLDFAGGRNFSSAKLAEMKLCIEQYIGERYGLEVSVKEPKELQAEPAYAELRVNKWQIAVVTAPENRSLPKQRVKLEIANVPAYTKQPLALQANYPFLPSGYSDLLIMTETLDEIMADKVISLAATRKYVRNRDVWDLPWLLQQGAKLNVDLVKRKIDDYKLDDYQNMLENLIQRLPEIVQDDSFLIEMRRFLPNDVFERTLGKEKFKVYLSNTLMKLFT